MIFGPKNQRVIFSPRSVHGSVHVGDSIPLTERFLIKAPIFEKVSVFVLISRFEACFREKTSVIVLLLPTPGNDVLER